MHNAAPPVAAPLSLEAALDRPVPLRQMLSSRSILIPSVAFALGCLPWYVAQFPSVLTFDSTDQLWQAMHASPLNAWHSPTVTLLLLVLGARADFYVFAQYVVFSLTIGAVLAVAAAGFAPSSGAWSWRRASLAAFAAGVFPPIGFFVSYLIDDVPFAASFLLAAAAWAAVVRESRYQRGVAFAVGFLSGVPWLFRHEGILVLLLFLSVGLLVARQAGRRWFRFVLLGGASAAAICIALPRVFGFVTHSTYPPAYSISLVQDLGGIVATAGRLDTQDREFLERIAPLERLAKHYNRAAGDVYVYENVSNFNWLRTHKAEFAVGYARIVSKNAFSLARERFARLLYDLGIRPNVVLAEDCPHPSVARYCPRSIVQHTWFQRAADKSARNQLPRLLFWCSLWPLLALGVVGFNAYRKRLWSVCLFSAVPLAFCSLSILVYPAAYFRYNYYLLPFAIAAVLARVGLATRRAGVAISPGITQIHFVGDQPAPTTGKIVPAAAAARSIERWSEAMRLLYKPMLIAGLAFAAGCLPWYLGQYPGVLTNDSVDQLWQASGMTPLNDIHSPAMTRVLRLLGARPGLYLIIQYILFSAIIGVAFTMAATGFRPRAPPNRRSLAWFAAIAGLLPPVGMHISWLIKDVPFAAALLLAATAWALQLRSPLRLGALLLGFLSGIPWLFRYDGIFALAVCLFAAIVVTRTRGWRWLALFALGLGLAVSLRAATLRGTIANLSRSAYSWAFVHDIAGILHQGGHLDAGDQIFVRKFANPVALAGAYNHVRGDIFFVDTRIADGEWLATHRTEFAAGYARLVAKNLRLLLWLRLIRFEHQSGIKDQYVFAAPIPESMFHFPASPIFFGDALRRPSSWNYDVPLFRYLFWCPALQLVLLFAAAAVGWRRNRWDLAFFAALPVISFLLFTIVANASYFRYTFYFTPFLAATALAMVAEKRIVDATGSLRGRASPPLDLTNGIGNQQRSENKDDAINPAEVSTIAVATNGGRDQRIE